MLTWAITFLLLAVIAGLVAAVTVGPVAPMIMMACIAGFIGTLAMYLVKRHGGSE